MKTENTTIQPSSHVMFLGVIATQRSQLEPPNRLCNQKMRDSDKNP